jgi:Xaa-Pro aminopeptidase
MKELSDFPKIYSKNAKNHKSLKYSYENNIEIKMIRIKNLTEIGKMRKAGKLAAQLLNYIEPFVKEGVSTLYLNDLCEEFTQKYPVLI